MVVPCREILSAVEHGVSCIRPTKKPTGTRRAFSLSIIVYLQLLNLNEPILVFQLKLLVVP